MKRINKFIKFFIFFVLIISFLAFIEKNEWGFYAHKKINRMAVFTLPPEMMYFFKSNIEYISDHAPDPDKLKFVNPEEGIRHFIDIDVWGEYPFEGLPKTWPTVMEKYAEIYLKNNDTIIKIFGPDINIIKNDSIIGNGNSCLSRDYKNFIYNKVAYKILGGKIESSIDTIDNYLHLNLKDRNWTTVIVEENFSKEGILPYYLYEHYRKLVKAFSDKDAKRILKLSTHFGHYIGDAHVPLHSTKNYNGQLTNQVGVHAFWENSVPELLCEEEYDFLVGKAEYIKDVRKFFWDIILKSHSLKNEVLRADSIINTKISEEKKFVFKERDGVVVKMQSEQLIRGFNMEMNDMVEIRMKDAVKALGDIWYTAWIDAGQPDLKSISKINWNEDEMKENERLKNIKGDGVLHGCGVGN
jgi:hypothetical protein